MPVAAKTFRSGQATKASSFGSGLQTGTDHPLSPATRRAVGFYSWACGAIAGGLFCAAVGGIVGSMAAEAAYDARVSGGSP